VKEKRRCKHIKKKGETCNAYAIAGSDYCFWHDPNKVKERNKAQSKGGLQGCRAVLNESNIRIEKTSDVVRLLAETINQVRDGRVDCRVASVVGYLANTMLRALEQGDMEERIEAIEKAVLEKG